MLAIPLFVGYFSSRTAAANFRGLCNIEENGGNRNRFFFANFPCNVAANAENINELKHKMRVVAADKFYNFPRAWSS